MAWFNQTAEYLGNRVEKIIGAGGGRLTVRSIKIFADGVYANSWNAKPHQTNSYQIQGALRSGGAAVGIRRLFSTITF